MECCIQVWRSQNKKDVDLVEQVQRRAARMIRGLENLFCKEKVRELGMFRLKKRRLQETLLQPFNTERRLIKKIESSFLLRQITIGQGGKVLNQKRGNLD